MDVGLLRGLFASGHPMLTQVVAVVGREDDVGVIELIVRLQLVDETGYPAIDGLQ